MPEATPAWQLTTIREVLQQRKERGHANDPLLSVTADRGVVQQSESGRRDISNEDKTTYLRIYPGDIVYNTMRMWQGVSSRSSQFGIVSPAYTVCSPTAGVDSRFVAHLLQLPRYIAEFKRRSQGLTSDTWNLKYSAFAQIKILVPPLVEQHKVAEILDLADESIRSAKRLIAKLAAVRDAEIEARLTSWLSRDRSEPKGTPEWSNQPLTYRRLGSLTSVNVGYVGPLSAQIVHDSSGIPLLSTRSITGERLARWDGRRVSRAFSNANRKSRVFAGDLIVARHGNSGSAAVVPEILSGAQCLNVVVVRRCKDFIPEFLALLLSWQEIAREISAAKAGSTQGVVNTAEMERLIVPVPTKAAQRNVLDAVSTYDNRIKVEEAALRKAVAIKQALMEDLLTGRVRSTVGQEPAA